MLNQKMRSYLIFFCIINNTAWGYYPIVVSLSSGLEWQNAGRTQTLLLQPSIVKTYAAKKRIDIIPNGEIFIGMSHPLNKVFSGQTGIAIAAADKTKFTGEIWDDANPAFDNFKYTYQVAHTYAAFKTKIVSNNLYYDVKPYVIGSIGVGFNKTSEFNSIPLVSAAIPTPNFKNHSTTSLSYTLGIGVQKAVDQNWQVGVNYEFANWGKSRLSRAPGQTTNNHLFLKHLYTNGIMFNLTYTV